MTDKQNEKKLTKKVVDTAEPQAKLYYICYAIYNELLTFLLPLFSVIYLAAFPDANIG